ncbi:hypothetical protein M427DRAFT_160668 [Gonapodya prolifera JEL478]|uniref:Ketopantoate reductase N-terminal domain-containing protein n=1 Tax=Gonapodya prolifera (strain JEL478) TaxID=1344416 RepID=A0A138ZYS0_GONPJ|nr:hypothetical protein M427DRAFT_160668 [Gonapodya prolifera JEL478]|eukprot:KXS09425.1 hypothetical protein M427DRAFT_160668 [Gonapodya prolifera JEL478]
MPEARPLNVIVVGAGAVGQVYAYHLLNAGCHVHLMVKEKYVEGISEYPLRVLRVGWFPPALFSSFFRRRLHRPEHFAPTTVLSVDGLPDDVTKPLEEQGLGGPVDFVILTMASDALRGPWLKSLATSLPRSIFLLLQPGPNDLEYLVSSGVERSRIAKGVIALASYQAPLPGDRYPIWIDESPISASKDVATVGTTAPRRNPAIIYFSPFPHPVSPPPNVPKETVDKVEELCASFRRGGLEVVRVKSRSNDLVTGTDLEWLDSLLGPILVALETSHWSFLYLAFNIRSLFLLWRAIREVGAAERAAEKDRRKGRAALLSLTTISSVVLFIAMSPLVLSPVLLVLYLINAIGLMFPVDFERLLAYHFAKVGGQTKFLVNEMIERYRKEASKRAKAGGAGDAVAARRGFKAVAALSELVKMNPRWAGAN